MGKKITNENLLGQRGINLIEECVLSMGFAWHPTNQAVEAGIDGHVELRNPDSEQALNLIVAIQSKARTDLSGETADSFTFYCDQRDIDYWLQGNIPVLLVVSRPTTREAYWVNVKQYFADPKTRQAKKIVFKKTEDRFDASVRDKLFAIARPLDSGLYLAPLPRSEQLLPNLLPVVLPTANICFAKTTYRDSRDVTRVINAKNMYPGLDWILHGNQIVSFRPLDQTPWTLVCDPASVKYRPTTTLANSGDPDERYLFVRLLGRCLEAKCRDLDIRFDGHREIFFFEDTDRLSTKTITFKSTARQSYRTVFEAYRDKETGKVRFCRHLAFEGHFRRLGTDWYLELTPTYRFTWDGRKPDRFADDRLKGIKRLERNRAVIGQLLTWIDILTQADNDLFRNNYPHLTFTRPPLQTLDVGINDDVWIGNEDPDEGARLNTEEAAANLLFNP